MSESELQAIEKRVEAALESFNRQTVRLENGTEAVLQLDKYDYRVTHYNAYEYGQLQTAMQKYAAGAIDELEIKAAIRAFRDRCAVASIDFAIRTAEPDEAEFACLQRLFGFEAGERVVPYYCNDEDRAAYLAGKAYGILDVITRDRNRPTAKVTRQFKNYWDANPAPSPNLLGLQHALTVDPQKQLKAPPEVLVNRDAEAQAEPQETQPEKLEAVDNSSFEANLSAGHAPLQVTVKAARSVLNPKTRSAAPAEVVTEVTVNDLHPAFAELCEQLYLGGAK